MRARNEPANARLRRIGARQRERDLELDGRQHPALPRCDAVGWTVVEGSWETDVPTSTGELLRVVWNNKIVPDDEQLKIPHMGWNTLEPLREHPLLERLPLGDKGRHAYFVHSYHLKAANEADVLARASYGGPVTAIVAKDTAIGTQFHPEKSQRFGLALIANFLKWKP